MQPHVNDLEPLSPSDAQNQISEETQELGAEDFAMWQRYLDKANDHEARFRDVPAKFRSDRDFVDGWLSRRQTLSRAITPLDLVLKHVPDALRADRSVVLKAVALDGLSVRFAHIDLRKDREVIFTAVAGLRGQRKCVKAFEWAVDVFSDEELIEELRKVSLTGVRVEDYCVFRVALLSGRACTVIADKWDNAKDICERASSHLEISDPFVKKQLVFQDSVVYTEETRAGVRIKGQFALALPGVRIDQVNHCLLVVCDPDDDAEQESPSGSESSSDDD